MAAWATVAEQGELMYLLSLGGTCQKPEERGVVDMFFLQ